MQRTIEFKGVTFSKLTRGERAKLNADFLAKRREKFVENLKAAGAEGEEFFNELENWDDTPRGIDPFIKSVNTDAGQVEVQLHCLRKIKADATEDDLPEMDDNESLKLTCDLAGLVLKIEPVSTSSEQAQEPAEPRPSEPDVYSQPE